MVVLGLHFRLSTVILLCSPLVTEVAIFFDFVYDYQIGETYTAFFQTFLPMIWIISLGSVIFFGSLRVGPHSSMCFSFLWYFFNRS